MKNLKTAKIIVLFSIALFGCLPAGISSLSTSSFNYTNPKDDLYKIWQDDLRRKNSNKIPYNGNVDIKLNLQSQNKTINYALIGERK
ncbi:MAG: hypothetical protein U0457_07225 [Candidatus Sericytochromatia bacterium]